MTGDDVQYCRLYADETGESHLEELDVELISRDFAPPAPPLLLSEITPADGFAFIRYPAGWEGDWHPAPRRQMLFFLSGEIAAEASDGDSRRFGPGCAVLVEDTTGKGHRSWVVGSDDVLAGVVQLPD